MARKGSKERKAARKRRKHDKKLRAKRTGSPGADAMDSGRRPSGVAVETGMPDDVIDGLAMTNAGDCNPQI